MSQFSKLTSMLVGLGCGGVLGLYIAQNYDLPDLYSMTEHLFSKAKDYKKEEKNKE